MKVKYRRIIVNIPEIEKPKECQCCHKSKNNKGKPRQIHTHHFKSLIESFTSLSFDKNACRNI